ncbi:MAG TPA: sigma-70 family RNA polymerase sigma factor [Candidatus Eisenbacteria bacterium]|jgi:RNA polymerase sigma-70 factor (ECF subfamily)|nr:sigma-70 family RNA polymerase sigma factor [Candidatus Eisenbacteria bacterium]
MRPSGYHESVAEKDSHATRSSLVRRLHDWRDDGGWQDFFDTYWKLIYAVAIKAGLSDVEAQDVVQETVVAVAKQMRAGGYDRTKCSFKTWLNTITRRRIIDHFRKRTRPKAQLPHDSGDTTRHGSLASLPDPANLELDSVWDSEWEKNLLDAAIERVKQKVTPKQFQIFDLAVLREVPTAEIGKLLKVNAAQVYLARHRVGLLVKKEVKRIEKQAKPPDPKP